MAGPIMKRSLDQNKTFFIFLTFGRDTKNYRGTLVENVKKSKFNPPYSEADLRIRIRI
jgi:hypothetical protein